MPCKLASQYDFDHPVALSDTQIRAFRSGVATLFHTYPPVEPEGYERDWIPVDVCRERFFVEVERGAVRTAAYMACDTGVPNELIHSLYLLLFDTGESPDNPPPAPHLPPTYLRR